MDSFNPYTPPMAPDPIGQSGFADGYSPLRTRTLVASIGIAATCIASFLLDAATLSGADAHPEQENLELQLGLLAAVGLLLVSHIFAIVTFCVWVHRAAKNLRGLGREGMQYTPGWCVGWFFIPFANLVQPFRAVREIYQASTGSVRGVLTLWWATWIIGNIIGNAASRLDDPIPSGSIGLVGSIFTAVAGFACIRLMGQITSGQEQIASSGH